MVHTRVLRIFLNSNPFQFNNKIKKINILERERNLKNLILGQLFNKYAYRSNGDSMCRKNTLYIHMYGETTNIHIILL